MTLRSTLLGEDVPSDEVVIYGGKEEDEWVQDLRHERPNLKVSLSEIPDDAGLESLQQDEDPDYDGGPSNTQTVFVLPPDAADKAIAQATDTALKNPDDTVVVVPDDEGDESLAHDRRDTFEKTGANVVNDVSVAMEMIKQRFPL